MVQPQDETILPDAKANLTPDSRAAITSLTTADQSSPTLRELADKLGIEIGAVGVIYHLKDSLYAKTLSTEFNLLELVDFAWPDNLRPTKDKFDFTNADAMVDFGMKNNMHIEGNPLAWGAPEFLPKWLTEGNFTRNELMDILRNHIKTCVSRYKGKIHAWTVANEVVSRKLFAKPGADFWYENIGPEYVEMAFRWAREADPNVILIYNQGNNEDMSNVKTNGVSNGTYDLVKDLKEKGVPIDGIGMQMHLLSPYSGDEENPPKKEDVISNMKRFASLDVKIYVTEFDVNLSSVPGNLDEKRAYQAKVYKDMLEACIESGVCKSFALFGFTDSYSWFKAMNLPDAEPLPFDKNYKPKPSYFALRGVLEEKIKERK